MLLVVLIRLVTEHIWPCCPLLFLLHFFTCNAVSKEAFYCLFQKKILSLFYVLRRYHQENMGLCGCIATVDSADFFSAGAADGQGTFLHSRTDVRLSHTHTHTHIHIHTHIHTHILTHTHTYTRTGASSGHSNTVTVATLTGPHTLMNAPEALVDFSSSLSADSSFYRDTHSSSRPGYLPDM